MASGNQHRRHPLMRASQPRPRSSNEPSPQRPAQTEVASAITPSSTSISNISTSNVSTSSSAPPVHTATGDTPNTPPSHFDDYVWGDEDSTPPIESDNTRALADGVRPALPPLEPALVTDVETESHAQETPSATAHRFSPLSLGLRVLLDIFLIGVALLVLHRPTPQPIALQPPPTPAPTATSTPLPTPAPIAVYVSGAVQKPALYQLAPDARVADALVLAGGLTAEADPALINQAELLFDGAQIHVPAKQSQAQSAALSSQPAAGVSGNAAVSTSSAGATGLVNINTASVDELTTLPGIGPSKAANIIAARPYATVDDLERATGIGAKTVDQLRDLVTVQ